MNAIEAIGLACHLSVLCRPVLGTTSNLGVGEALEADFDGFYHVDAQCLGFTQVEPYVMTPGEFLAKWEVLTVEHLQEEYRKATSTPF